MSDHDPTPDDEIPAVDALDWDLDERDQLLAEGTLLEDLEPETTVIVQADE